jgi:protein gp37
MSNNSAIEWTDATWNPIVGCSIVSPGCTNCYAMKMAARIQKMNRTGGSNSNYVNHYDGTTKSVKGSAVWTGKLALAPDKLFLKPLSRRAPTIYFVNSMGDLFHEDCPDEWIDRVFAVMALSPQHTFQVLTKRAARMRDYCLTLGRHHEVDRVSIAMKQIHTDHGFGANGAFYTMGAIGWHFKNIWLGVSTERQQEADERIPLLLRTPAAVRFISAEPLLGPINLTSINHRGVVGGHSALHDRGLGKLDWVITGAESGPGARECAIEWVRGIKEMCIDAGVPFFWKQHAKNGKKIPTPKLDGRIWTEMPRIEA